MSEDHHLAAVEQRSARTTDPIALNLFRQLMRMDVWDRQLVLITLDGHLTGISGERVVLVRSAVERFQAETGQSLAKKRYERWRVAHPERAALPSATYIATTWNGSWATAMDKLGLRPAPNHAVRRMATLGVRPTDSELLELLRSCAADVGHTPRVLEYRRWRQQQLRDHETIVFGEQTYRRRFGGWHQAIESAGLPVRPRARRTISTEWTSEDAVRYLRTAAEEGDGARLRVSQYDAWRRAYLAEQDARGTSPAIPRGDSIAARFGGWLRALAAAGLINDDAAANLRIGHGRSFSDADIDEALARFARDTHGKRTSCAYQRWCESTMEREHGTHLPGRAAIANRLDGWPNAAERILGHRRPPKAMS
jgi:hypothetical protein